MASFSNDHSTWTAANRRAFMTDAARALLGVSAVSALPTAGRAAEGSGGRAESVIYLFLSGGISHLDTFDPKPDSDVQGETKPIQTALPGVRVGEHLPQLAKRLKQVAVIRSMTTQTGAHGPARYVMRTSYKEIATTRHPGLGAWTQNILGKRNQELPGNVLIGGASQHPGAGFLAARNSPVPIGNPEAGLQNTKSPSYLKDSQFDKRMKLTNSFDSAFRRRYENRDVTAYTQLYQEAIKLLKSTELKAFDIKQESEKTRERYGDNRFGQGCLLARRLVESKVRYVEVVSGGWDHHRDVFTTLPTKAGELDRAVSALLDDLQANGLLSRTLVVIATEFGRTPKINQNVGRDHHPAVFSAMLAGGGIRGGQVYGASDEEAREVEEEPVEASDLNATIGYAAGLPIEKEFVSPAGRPFKVAHDGRALTELF
ncbi:MAG: DUF1501 domain-containing protein [Pirellulaceae bacterium]|jgi:hypothetical protein|nr:DUF1501 domain-containing protein [Pirellulaceae bacterium]MDP7017056.1 DUF1501 domain-containing protein [Pirellulaceae bacterium]